MEGCPGDVVTHLADGTLTNDQRARLEAHVAGCEHCAERIAGTAPPSLPARYELRRELGRGGMGRVYAVRDRELGRDVAIKVILAETATPERTARLVRESQLMARVRHPNVVTVYDVGEHDGRVYISMELFQGSTLGSWLRAAPRGWREILAVVGRAGEGLAEAHRAGLVHRDIKPDNILIDLVDGVPARVAIGDFGVARSARASESERPPPASTTADEVATAAGALVGTPAYMAPEQIDGDDVDARADVFAYACTVWEALYGTRPYPGRTLIAIREAMTRPPEVPRGMAPRWVGRALQRALEPDRALRPATVTELVRALDPRPRDRRRARLIGAAIAVAAVTAVIVGWPRSARDCEDPSREMWSGDRRGRIVHAFDALSPAFAHGLGERLASATDAWLRDWRTTHHTACRAEPTERMRQLACLDRELRRVDAHLVALEHPDIAAAAAAASPGHGLPSLACEAPPAGEEPIGLELRGLATVADRAAALQWAGRHAEASRLVEASRAHFARATQPSFLAATMFDLAQIWHEDGRLPEAKAAYARARDAATAIGDGRRATMAMIAIADLAADSGDLPGAAATLDGASAVARLERIGYTERISIARAKLAIAGGDLPTGIAELERTIAVLRAGPLTTDTRTALVHALGLCAEAELAVSTPPALEKARARILEARELVIASSGIDHPDLGRLDAELAAIEGSRGKLEESIAALERAATVLRTSYGDDGIVVLKVRANLGFTERFAGHPERARTTLADVAARMKRTVGDDFPDLADIEADLGGLELELGNEAAAEMHLDSALARWDRLGKRGPSIARTLGERATLDAKRRDLPGAIARLERALEHVRDEALASDRASLLVQLADVLLAAHRLRDAAARVVEVDALLPGLAASDAAEVRAALAPLRARLPPR